MLNTMSLAHLLEHMGYFSSLNRYNMATSYAKFLVPYGATIELLRTFTPWHVMPPYYKRMVDGKVIENETNNWVMTLSVTNRERQNKNDPRVVEIYLNIAEKVLVCTHAYNW
jgi:hypothetical protein